MKHFQDEWIQQWCEQNGWTDLTKESYISYWAFPPGAVMPEPIPFDILRSIKDNNGTCVEEKFWLSFAIILSVASVFFSYWLKNPVPVIFAFAFDAFISAKLEFEEI
ncbi:hypothetical protein [Candidatus Atelocyanobacterium thalassae]|uniref:Uncharacterized protein n=1 Tax=cyanobacterium endosymbiont of Braarudosphaera bigelowii TaxID=1285375 RepID=A0ABN6K3V0_9CHRO|nr:hypothetical protein [Candidatus Atelocyanobacterium thalassa]BDA39881.1 hypothetical protein CPARK_000072100 [cyanobacterium endosymbiont of Braarudosphaera bigelowii]